MLDYNPFNWFWILPDGSVYSSQTAAYVQSYPGNQFTHIDTQANLADVLRLAGVPAWASCLTDSTPETLALLASLAEPVITASYVATQEAAQAAADQAALALKANLNSPSLVTPNIGAATATSLAATGALTSSGGGIGYATGAGGTVTQGTSRTTGVTLNKLTGTITMFSSAVAAAGSSSFVLTNSFISATDTVLCEHNGVTNACSWQVETIAANGSCTIVVKNISAASITEATPLKFLVIKAVNA